MTLPLEALEQQIRQHAYLTALETGRIEPDQLRYFVGKQCHIIPGDLRSIALSIAYDGKIMTLLLHANVKL